MLILLLLYIYCIIYNVLIVSFCGWNILDILVIRFYIFSEYFSSHNIKWSLGIRILQFYSSRSILQMDVEVAFSFLQITLKKHNFCFILQAFIEWGGYLVTCITIFSKHYFISIKWKYWAGKCKNPKLRLETNQSWEGWFCYCNPH